MASFADDEFRVRIERFYNHYQPQKLSDVPSLLEKVKGKPDRFEKLMGKLVQKYGPEPEVEDDDEEEEDDVDDEEEEEEELAEDMEQLQVGGFDEAGTRARLVRFYEKYQPEKVGDVDKLMNKIAGDQAQADMLFNMLQKKYGPEPVDGEDEADEDDEDEETDEQDDEDSFFKKVVYCPVDGFPPEYCEYAPTFEEALPWLLKNCPDLKLTTKKDITVAEFCAKREESGAPIEDKGKKGKGAAGGKNQKGKKKNQAPEVTMETVKRNKRRNVTIVIGLDTFDIKLKEAAKALGRRFASGASINKMANGKKSIEIQGDWIYDLPEVIKKLYKEIPEDQMFVIDGGNKTPAF